LNIAGVVFVKKINKKILKKLEYSFGFENTKEPGEVVTPLHTGKRLPPKISCERKMKRQK
jgi:hypothetical protein